MDVYRLACLLIVYIWIGCIDLEAQRKGKSEVPEWFLDHLRQVNFSTLVKCIESCISLWYVLASNGTWWWVDSSILNNSNDEKGVVKSNVINCWCVMCWEWAERLIDALLMLYHNCIVVNCALLWKWSSPHYLCEHFICIGYETWLW